MRNFGITIDFSCIALNNATILLLLSRCLFKECSCWINFCMITFAYHCFSSGVSILQLSLRLVDIENGCMSCHVADLLNTALTALRTILVRLTCVKTYVMRFRSSSSSRWPCFIHDGHLFEKLTIWPETKPFSSDGR